MSRSGRKNRAAAAGIIVLAVPAAAAALLAVSANISEGTVAKAAAALSMAEVFPVQTTEDAAPADKPVTDLPKDGYPVSANLASFAVDDSDMLSWGELDIPNSSDEERYVPEESEDPGPKPYPESLEGHDGVITAVTYGHMTGDNYIGLSAGQIRNLTDIPNDKVLEEVSLTPEFALDMDGSPEVLIMHTHATESYEPYERDFYDASFSSRTTDRSMNMAAVGDAIAKELETAGIGVIHDTTLHDYPSYNGSYDRSRETVQKYLEEYPSIKIVLDVHRDAIERSGGERIAPTADIGGENAAQVMIICGCDDGTMDMPDYMKNLRFGCMLQTQLESDWPGLTRPLLFDYRKYNQDLTPGSILIEVGGHANSIDQAVYSGELVGKSLAECLSKLT